MKKRVYRATKVKDLNLKQLEKEADGKEIILGVNVAKEYKEKYLLLPIICHVVA
ncbi:MAG: hypothetical protein U9Q89_05215 [Thermodesulfobacteriota bacterium]|nr:hypothetical protein [Thermodesulfobacteriota bacterium]